MCKRLLKKGHFRTIGPSDYRAVTIVLDVSKSELIINYNNNS